MSDSHLDNIVDECSERLAAGESVTDCLARYPEHADELAPLLRNDARHYAGFTCSYT